MAELETAVSFYLAVIDPENDDENCVARIEARDKAVALRAKRELLSELARGVESSKWLDLKLRKESGWGRAYGEVMREMRAKYQDQSR